MFDAISYCKGACVVKMLNAVLGMDMFKKGLQVRRRRETAFRPHARCSPRRKGITASIPLHSTGTVLFHWPPMCLFSCPAGVHEEAQIRQHRDVQPVGCLDTSFGPGYRTGGAMPMPPQGFWGGVARGDVAVTSAACDGRACGLRRGFGCAVGVLQASLDRGLFGLWGCVSDIL